MEVKIRPNQYTDSLQLSVHCGSVEADTATNRIKGEGYDTNASLLVTLVSGAPSFVVR